MDIEEDIKILEKDLFYYNEIKENFDEGTVKFYEALKHILAEREADKKRIKELEEERQLVGMPVKNKRDGSIGVVLHQWNSGSIAVLENINPRVINTHDSWSTLEIITDEVKQIQTKDDSIPKQKIKDKIKEIKEDKESKYFDKFLIIRDINYAIEILEELLEDK